jgi:hypothetical protein
MSDVLKILSNYWKKEVLGSIVQSSLMLRPTVRRPACFGIKHPSGAYDQIIITVRQLRVCWFGTLSLTREWVCRLLLLLALASTVILGPDSLGTRDHIQLSQIRIFPFRRLLRLAGLRWWYSTPPTHGSWTVSQKSQSHIRLTVSHSVSLSVEPHMGLMTR